MSSDIYQYETALPGEICEEVVVELTEIMGIEFDSKKYKDAIEYQEDMISINNICVFHDQQKKERFIMCVTNDHFFRIVVRCTYQEHDKVKRYLLDRTNKAYEDYEFDDRFKDLKNTYNTERDSYQQFLKLYNVDYI